MLTLALCRISPSSLLKVGPYKELHDDFVANTCSFLMLICFICCLVFKVSTLVPHAHRHTLVATRSSPRSLPRSSPRSLLATPIATLIASLTCIAS